MQKPNEALTHSLPIFPASTIPETSAPTADFPSSGSESLTGGSPFSVGGESRRPSPSLRLGSAPATRLPGGVSTFFPTSNTTQPADIRLLSSPPPSAPSSQWQYPSSFNWPSHWVSLGWSGYNWAPSSFVCNGEGTDGYAFDVSRSFSAILCFD